MAPHAVSSFVESLRLALQTQGGTAVGGTGVGGTAVGGTGVGGPGPVVADASLMGLSDGTTVIIAIVIAVVLIAVLYPVARAIARRMERGTPVKGSNGSSDERMHRLEQSVEGLTLEIERISEGQRYTTKLLTERLPLAVKVPQPGQSDKTLL